MCLIHNRCTLYTSEITIKRTIRSYFIFMFEVYQGVYLFFNYILLQIYIYCFLSIHYSHHIRNISQQPDLFLKKQHTKINKSLLWEYNVLNARIQLNYHLGGCHLFPITNNSNNNNNTNHGKSQFFLESFNNDRK